MSRAEADPDRRRKGQRMGSAIGEIEHHRWLDAGAARWPLVVVALLLVVGVVAVIVHVLQSDHRTAGIARRCGTGPMTVGSERAPAGSCSRWPRTRRPITDRHRGSPST